MSEPLGLAGVPDFLTDFSLGGENPTIFGVDANIWLFGGIAVMGYLLFKMIFPSGDDRSDEAKKRQEQAKQAIVDFAKKAQKTAVNFIDADEKARMAVIGAIGAAGAAIAPTAAPKIQKAAEALQEYNSRVAREIVTDPEKAINDIVTTNRKLTEMAAKQTQKDIENFVKSVEKAPDGGFNFDIPPGVVRDLASDMHIPAMNIHVPPPDKVIRDAIQKDRERAKKNVEAIGNFVQKEAKKTEKALKKFFHW